MPDSVALLLYSSGTTGFPKGVLITHDNLLTGLRDVRATGQAWGAWLPEETVLLATPIFHIGGTGWVTQALAAGSATVAIPRPEVTAMVRAITTEKVTKFFAVPAILSMMMKDGQASRANFASVRYILYGASPISLAVLKEAMATFVNAEFVQVYGATETTGAITYLSPEEHRHSDEALLESCGKPFPGGAARIVDADGKVLAAGEIGEIEIRSSAVTPGYLDDAEATRAAFHHGWYRTGDAGYRDAEGYLYIRDRIKDMIVSGGENIYPAEVEAVLNTHPAVDECAIIGVPDARWGETAKAVVVLRAGAEASGEQLRDFLRGRVAGYKIPKSIDFTGSLPRNPSGKILKRTLREPYWRDEGRRIA
jgi:long-chain acyl-CoA synthetase